MSPRNFLRVYNPEAAREIDQGYSDMGIIVVNAFTKGLKFLFPFFIPRAKESNKTDTHNAEGIEE